MGGEHHDGRVNLRRPFGTGYVQEIGIGKDLNMIIRNYEQFEDVIVAPDSHSKTEIIFKVLNVFKNVDDLSFSPYNSLPAI